MKAKSSITALPQMPALGQDFAKAADFLERAANKGHRVAARELAYLLLQGNGRDQNAMLAALADGVAGKARESATGQDHAGEPAPVQAVVLDQLLKAGAKSVTYDIYFSGPDIEDEKYDTLFAYVAKDAAVIAPVEAQIGYRKPGAPLPAALASVTI